MRFYEEIGIIKYSLHAFVRGPARYLRKSMFLTVFLRAFPYVSKKLTFIKHMNYDGVESYADVLKNAYLNGERYVSQMDCERFFRKSANLFGIDFVAIFKKYVFNQVICPRYKFFELAMRYAEEHPNEKHVFHISSSLTPTPYRLKMKTFGVVYTSTRFIFLEYLSSLLLCPILLWLYWKIKGQSDAHYFENNIICNAVKVPTRDIFRKLFGMNSQTRYVMPLPYIERYAKGEIERFGIIPIKLSKDSYRHLRKHVLRYVIICLKCYREVAIYGLGMFRLFFHIIMGREKAPHGKGNLFITFEHFNSTVAICNEFIRMEGSKSVFFAQNLNVCCKYDFDEAFSNYDIICSAGRQSEDHLAMNRTSATSILPTGSYDAHKEIEKRTRCSNERITKLESFISGSNAVITALSCGLVDKSYNIEKKLMSLANKISRQPGTRVLIRFKTRFKMPIYDNFYDQFTEGNSSILLTGAEYELTDFLPITDLFITSISNSGFDVAMRAGCVMFVDFLKTPDLFLPWELIGGVVVSEEKAFENIMKWINDSKNGHVRTKHRKVMDHVTEYMGYTFPDFETYKENLMNQLRNHVSPFSEICDRENE